jgi:hypothetical protein
MNRRTRLHTLFKKQPAVFVFVLLLLAATIIFPTVLLIDPTNTNHAEFYFVDIPHIMNVGQIIPVELHLRTGSEAINAVGSEIDFNPKVLEVVTITTEQSFCTLYTENTFDNIKGTVKVSCGNPNPGFTGDSTIVKVTFRARSSNTTKLTLNSNTSQILANDGKGTNLVHSFPSLEIKVSAL